MLNIGSIPFSFLEYDSILMWSMKWFILYITENVDKQSLTLLHDFWALKFRFSNDYFMLEPMEMEMCTGKKVTLDKMKRHL